MLVDRLEGAITFVWIERIAFLHRRSDGFLIQAPQLQRMIHSAGHNLIAQHIKVGAQHFIAMTFNAAKYRNTSIRFDVPQSQRMILAGRQKHVRLFRMEFQFVDRMTVTNVVFVACHESWIENSNDAPITGGS